MQPCPAIHKGFEGDTAEEELLNESAATTETVGCQGFKITFLNVIDILCFLSVFAPLK